MKTVSRTASGGVVLLVFGLAVAGCGGAGPRSPTWPTPTASPGAPPRQPKEAKSFEMIGTVTDEAGTPISGARVSIWLDYVDLASSFTDGAGRYAVQFVGTPGANHVPGYDPPGTEDATAFVNVDAPGYEPYSRYVIGTDEHLVEHVRLRRIWRLQAGESAAVTIDPDDSVCVLDAWPGRELICRTLRVVPSRNALLTVEAVAATPGPSRLELEVHGAVSGAPRTNPTTFPVTAGAEYKVHVEVPWGPAGQSRVVVRTGIVER